MTNFIDEADRRILRLVQEDAGLTRAEIAERSSLSASPCWRRLDRMEREGLIRKRVALLDRRKAGFNAHIFAHVKLNAPGRGHLDEFAEAIRGFPEVLECYTLMGPVDFLMRVVAKDIEAYERFFFVTAGRRAGSSLDRGFVGDQVNNGAASLSRPH